MEAGLCQLTNPIRTATVEIFSEVPRIPVTLVDELPDNNRSVWHDFNVIYAAQLARSKAGG